MQYRHITYFSQNWTLCKIIKYRKINNFSKNCPLCTLSFGSSWCSKLQPVLSMKKPLTSVKLHLHAISSNHLFPTELNTLQHSKVSQNIFFFKKLTTVHFELWYIHWASWCSGLNLFRWWKRLSYLIVNLIFKLWNYCQIKHCALWTLVHTLNTVSYTHLTLPTKRIV